MDLQQLNLGVFLGVLFEIRTFLVTRNHMIFSYKMKFCSIPADPPFCSLKQTNAIPISVFGWRFSLTGIKA